MILFISDDPELGELVNMIFLREGIKVVIAHDVESRLLRMPDEEPQLILLDLNMPDMDGWEKLQAIRDNRKYAHIPIIILSAQADDEHIVRGLQYGAVDYISKPFSPRVLLARTLIKLQRNIPRRPNGFKGGFNDGNLEIDLNNRRITLAGERVQLTATEYKLLAYLVKNAGRVRTFSQIMENVWEHKNAYRPAYVHVYVSRLRKKLEPNPRDPIYVLSVYGIGYRFT